MPEPDSTGNGTRKALIISVSNYDNLQKLDFCKNDGEKIYDILKSQNYEILQEHKLIGNVNHDQIKNAIIDFFKGENVKRRDTLFFYFSGHGFFDGEGDTYLSTSDFDPDQPDKKGYRFDELTRQMNKSISSKIVVALDCCYSGAAGLGGKGEGDAEKLGRDALDSSVKNKIKWGEGRCILASSLGYQESFRMSDEPYSAFTYFLARGLEGANGESVDEHGFVTPALLGRYVTDKLLEMPRPMQRPILKLELTGEIVLASHPDKKKPKPIQTPVFEPQPWYKSKIKIAAMALLGGIFVGVIMLLPTLPPNLESYSYLGEISLQKDPIVGSIAVDSTGHVYAADSANSRILKLTDTGHVVKQWSIFNHTENNFGGFSDIVIDSSDNVYVVYDVNRIQKFTSEGIQKEFQTSNFYDYGFIFLQTDSSDNVYVLDSYTRQINKFTSNGTFVKEFELPETDTPDLLVSDFVLDSSDNVYITMTSIVSKFANNGTFDKTLELPAEVQHPRIVDVAIDSFGSVYAAYYDSGDFKHYYVAKFTDDEPDGHWVISDFIPYSIFSDLRLVIDHTNNVLVIDRIDDYQPESIRKFTNDGEFIEELKPFGEKELNIADIHVDHLGNLYVAYGLLRTDEFNENYVSNISILKLDSEGKSSTEWMIEDIEGNPSSFFQMTINSFDDVYVFQSDANMIQKFTSGGKFVTEWPVVMDENELRGMTDLGTNSQGDVYGFSAYPRPAIIQFTKDGILVKNWTDLSEISSLGYYSLSFFVDSLNNIYYATHDGEIRKFKNDGEYVPIKNYVLSSDEIDFVTEIALDASNNIFVVDFDKNTIMKFSSDGQFVTKWGRQGVGIGEFSDITDIALDSSGNVYVSETQNKRIQKFTNDGTFITMWGGTSSADLVNPEEISINSKGDVYVLDSDGNNISIYGLKT